MKIKTITPKDIPKLYELWEKAKLPIKSKGRDSESHLSRELEGSQSIFLKMVDQNDVMIGAVLGTHDGRKGWINRLSVHPDHRGKGIAKKLVEAVEMKLVEIGIHIIASLIEDYNTASMKLFEELGYKKHFDILYFTKRKDSSI